MGDTAGIHLLLAPILLHIIQTHFIAEYVNKTHILTCILKHLNSNKVSRAKILSQTTNFNRFHREYIIARGDVSVGASVMF